MRVLSINSLLKKYGAITAVNNLNLTVEKGNVFGLLGPNGSGKTTTLGIILGITQKDSGTYTWFENQEVANPRKQLGALLETPNFYPYMSAVKNLEIIAHIKKVKQNNFDKLLDLVDLSHRKDHKFKTYSLGMKQRLAIAGAMVGDPEVLIFDEPTNGLDPQGIAEVRGIIKRIADQGKTIIMASHMLDEVEKVCSHVAIIKRGKLLAQGTVGSIINDDITIEVSCSDLEKLKQTLESVNDINQMHIEKGNLIIQAEPSFSTADLNQLAFQKGLTLTHLVAKTRSLESEFLEITKNQ